MADHDEKLGWKVHRHLMEKGLETPMTSILKPDFQGRSEQERIKNIEFHMKAIIEELGLDLQDDSLIETPKRIAKMWVKEMFEGLDYKKFPKCTMVENKWHEGHSDMVIEKNIQLVSACEHHFLPVLGTGQAYAGVTVAYIPGRYVLGLSKINRVVNFFAKRPQLQERLTYQILEGLSCVIGSPDVAVFVEGQHLCVSTRGPQDPSSSTVTTAFGGRFLSEPALKEEFLKVARGP